MFRARGARQRFAAVSRSYSRGRIPHGRSCSVVPDRRGSRSQAGKAMPDTRLGQPVVLHRAWSERGRCFACSAECQRFDPPSATERSAVRCPRTAEFGRSRSSGAAARRRARTGPRRAAALGGRPGPAVRAARESPPLGQDIYSQPVPLRSCTSGYHHQREPNWAATPGAVATAYPPGMGSRHAPQIPAKAAHSTPAAGGGLHPTQGVSAFHVGRQGGKIFWPRPFTRAEPYGLPLGPRGASCVPKTSSRRCAMTLRATLDPRRSRR